MEPATRCTTPRSKRTHEDRRGSHPGDEDETSDYVALAKPRLNVLVVASALAGYAMAGGEHVGRDPGLLHARRDRRSSPVARRRSTSSSSATRTA